MSIYENLLSFLSPWFFHKNSCSSKTLAKYIKFDTLDHSTNLLILYSYRWMWSTTSFISWGMEEISSLSVTWTSFRNFWSARTPSSLELSLTIRKERNCNGWLSLDHSTNLLVLYYFRWTWSTASLLVGEWRRPYLWEGFGPAFGTSGPYAPRVLWSSAQWSRRRRSAVANCCKSPRKDWTSHCGGNSVYLEGKQLARWTCQSNAGSSFPSGSFPSVWAEYQPVKGTRFDFCPRRDAMGQPLEAPYHHKLKN